MVFIFYLILLEYNVPQDFKSHYTSFNIMPHNTLLLSGPSHDAKHPIVGTLFVSSTTHTLTSNERVYI
ncbi:hypothetical protein Hanom_Chr13g01238271 [Helianthus anomalus]